MEFRINDLPRAERRLIRDGFGTINHLVLKILLEDGERASPRTVRHLAARAAVTLEQTGYFQRGVVEAGLTPLQADRVVISTWLAVEENLLKGRGKING